jgi:hypothetical protein
MHRLINGLAEPANVFIFFRLLHADTRPIDGVCLRQSPVQRPKSLIQGAHGRGIHFISLDQQPRALLFIRRLRID